MGNILKYTREHYHTIQKTFPCGLKEGGGQQRKNRADMATLINSI